MREFRFKDNWRIIKLVAVQELLQESLRMENCLNNIERFKNSDIYSLRSPVDKPVANIEIRNGLLIQISGHRNNRILTAHHSRLKSFLLELGISSTDISARLGLIEFFDSSFQDIETCTNAFTEWANKNTKPECLPFMRDPKVREFLNVFARFGNAAKNSTKLQVVRHFTPRGKSWQQCRKPIHLANKILIFRPKLPTALYHLGRYDVIPNTIFEVQFKNAIEEILYLAANKTCDIYDISFRNSIFAPEIFVDLIRRNGLHNSYTEARKRFQTEKLLWIKTYCSKNNTQECLEGILERLTKDKMVI